MIPDRQSSDSLSTQAAQLISAEIMKGRFRPGARLNELRLASELTLSRGPIREALRALEREGLVISLPNRGSFVQRVTASDMSELLSLRDVLEPFAFEQAVRSRGPALAGPLLNTLSQMREAVAGEDWARVAGLHAGFHGVLYSEAAGHLLADTWSRLTSLLQIHLRSLEWTSEQGHVHLTSHERLAEVLIEGDLTEGRAAIAAHLAQARAALPFPFSGIPSETSANPRANRTSQ